MLRWPRVERELTWLAMHLNAERIARSLMSGKRGRDIVAEFEKISYARVRVESRSKDGKFDRVVTAYAAGMGLV